MSLTVAFSSSRSKLNLPLITHYLSEESYWAKGRDREKILRSIDNSFCLGAYLNDQQIGFLRVVTDYETHAYIMDAFVISEYRGNGVGSKLLQQLIKEPSLLEVESFCLRTQDAEKFYQRFGFEPSGDFLVMQRHQ